MAGLWNPGYYKELRQKEKKQRKEHNVKYFDRLALAHTKGEISGQGGKPNHESWANDREREEMIKRKVFKEHHQAHWGDGKGNPKGEVR